MKGLVNSMKKQNILDLLADDFEKRYNQEKSNKKEIIKNDDEEKNMYHIINIFLTNNYKIYNLDFSYNIKSTNETEKAKSLYLLYECISASLDLIGITPSFFKHYEKEYDKRRAFEEICFRVLLGNILDYKKELKQINEKNANEIIMRFQKLHILITTKYTP